MLKTIPVNELEIGMYVDSIAVQNGNLKIKSRGRVTSGAAIAAMKKQGIVSLIIDLSKQLPKPEESLPQVDEVKEIDISFADEIAKAAKLHDKGKTLQRRLLQSVNKGLPIDIAIPKEFTTKLVSSIHRNPNALLCMTKIREKDSYLLEHSLNVAILLANFASYLEMPDEEVQELALSGFLHDIGKIKVPDDILHKPGRLTDQEMVVMRDHVYFGVRVLEDMGIPERIIETISQHHERLDGYGYPEGARGDEIGLFGRMIAIVDTYDAITADRCYKAGMPSQKALKILHADTPIKYDQHLVEQFIKCIGVYPVGSLVKLSSEKIAVVIKQNDNHPLKPLVKVFYSVRSAHYLSPVEIDLLHSQYRVEKAVMASEFKLDFNRYFNESIAI
ncbi:HD-GYP domain-containing protein [uncultured Paraglaciecola sp.]|uniref:HD-GYP domain-containing protein n=1 Tax=uncultured Paraglaciecola sp. TaxID=1765024 RepID=UPI0030DB5BD0